MEITEVLTMEDSIKEMKRASMNLCGGQRLFLQDMSVTLELSTHANEIT